jgi:exodeoxyribonuclease VII small subunit
MARSVKGQGLGRLETSLRELEQVVERLETGEMPLEQALKEFELGVRLTRECQSALKEAEQKVEILLKKTATAAPEPFANEEPADET